MRIAGQFLVSSLLCLAFSDVASPGASAALSPQGPIPRNSGAMRVPPPTPPSPPPEQTPDSAAATPDSGTPPPSPPPALNEQGAGSPAPAVPQASDSAPPNA